MTLRLDGSEVFDLTGLDERAQPRQCATLVIRREDGSRQTAVLTLRIDTGAELEYVKRGGILPCVLKTLLVEQIAGAEPRSLVKT